MPILPRIFGVNFFILFLGRLVYAHIPPNTTNEIETFESIKYVKYHIQSMV